MTTKSVCSVNHIDHVGLAVKDGEDTAVEIHVSGDRDATKHGATQAAIDLLGRQLQGA